MISMDAKNILSVIVLLTLLSGCYKSPQPKPQVSIKGRVWTVELATTADQRNRGLSGRDRIDDDAGMLFIYPNARPRVFCMRGCEVPIDVIFIDADLKVVNFYEMRVESDRRGRVPYASYLPARYILELAGGMAGKAGIKIGDQVEFLNIPPGLEAEEGL